MFLVRVLVVEYFAWQRYLVSQANVLSTCTVTAAELSYNSEDSKHAYTPKITIEHEVDGRR